jgi:hypothetical protein
LGKLNLELLCPALKYTAYPRAWSAVAAYEIRTLTSRARTSLIGVAEYPNDVVAIVAARKLMRTGETIEIWRDGKLIYRVAPRGKY